MLNLTTRKVSFKYNMCKFFNFLYVYIGNVWQSLVKQEGE